MTQPKPKSRLPVMIAVLVALLISGFLIANWSDFKAGLLGGPAPGRSAAP